jgi:hypothetical protein
VDAYQVDAYQVDAYQVDAYQVDACQVDACQAPQNGAMWRHIACSSSLDIARSHDMLVVLLGTTRTARDTWTSLRGRHLQYSVGAHAFAERGDEIAE